MTQPTVGVLALQGDVREHLAAVEHLGAHGLPVRRVSELEAVDGLIIPGGESTTIWKLARSFDVFEAVAGRIKAGMPTFGTCAGMVLLADHLLDGVEGQETFGGLDITVRRNAFGRQVDSFESDVQFSLFDSPVHAVFIRAPWVEDAGPEVQTLASVGDRIVAVQQGSVMATSFHPEVSDDLRLHRYFLNLINR